MQVSNCKNGMQESNESNAKKVNKKVSNSKMSKNQKAAANSNPTPETYRESPQNVRLDTSESDEESVSEQITKIKRKNYFMDSQIHAYDFLYAVC
ncbi:CLUMA_CG005922, isoform A [Clunio marinus]|uniref:CLUMA_CG005922, isoform A n=1 Tax=Clunio marinus TaxID=568069 RepID=A0A1J1I1Y2_9DIPT|nr:CLUMA_CG005922, isoform A [Clunio marinus]